MKKRLLLLALFMLALPVLSAVAHHSYAEYDRDKSVVMEGAVKNVLWVNPHVLITLETEDHGEYSVEWKSLSQLSRQGMKPPFVIKSGDRLVVTGSVNRNPEKRIVSLVRQILRPADG